MEPEQIEEMYSNLEEIEVLGAAIRLEITGVSYFPNENSQVLVANISIPTQLQKLRSQVQALVSQIGFDTNQKGYRPIGRTPTWGNNWPDSNKWQRSV